MLRLPLAPLLVAFILLSAPGQTATRKPAEPPAGVQKDEVIRIGTELVVVDAQVFHKKTGRMIGGLGRNDFELYEDGVRQEIRHFSQDQLPLTVVFLFDLTDTVRPVLKSLASGALLALQHLKPEDEAAVMVYAAGTEVLQELTRDRQLVARAIARASDMQSPDAAFFNEAVYQAARQTCRAASPANRRVIIWLTDNVPNAPSESMRRRHGKGLPADAHLHSEKEAFEELFESGPAVSVLLERSALSVLAEIFVKKNPILAISRRKTPPGDVYDYAAQTGGEVMKSGREEVSTKLAELLDHIRARYSVGYTPSNLEAGGKFHKLKLKLTAAAASGRGEVVIQARQGYYRRPNPENERH